MYSLQGPGPFQTHLGNIEIRLDEAFMDIHIDESIYHCHMSFLAILAISRHDVRSISELLSPQKGALGRWGRLALLLLAMRQRQAQIAAFGHGAKWLLHSGNQKDSGGPTISHVV